MQIVLEVEVERAMGIEHPAASISGQVNQQVTSEEECCVRFWCEKRCHDSQRQP
jgi:hypothetical protein